MTNDILPRTASLADVTMIDFNSEGTVQIGRLITRGLAGSELLTGVCTAQAGALMSWTQSDGLFETYYVVRGRLTVTWTQPDAQPGSAVLGPNEAIFLAPGWTFEVEAHEETFIVYSLTPPSV